MSVDLDVIQILVTCEEGILSFQTLGSEPVVTLDSGGNLQVPVGEHTIRFTRLADTEWRFGGFRYRPQPNGAAGPLTSIEMTDSYIQVLDVNRNSGRRSHPFQYEIRILLPGGDGIWIDPVIENQPGEPPSDGR